MKSSPGAEDVRPGEAFVVLLIAGPKDSEKLARLKKYRNWVHMYLFTRQIIFVQYNTFRHR
jgi:hypothetical protein